ncbi:MAG TPA: peptidoglycan binding domain-containing protein [Candidatus Scatomonas pullistercoris]|uniref:Peptidoglycan binding domain-containing protein n=1 Tax=Candidatus Scatomonas pullistercoris TaxID=2840920 RepID=A0A9D1TA25_9FIRM|nr:peptidoglycan binding domain-containing protein [Candidatus Scatomonas pullistercoris]
MGEDRMEKGLEEQLRKALASEETEEHGESGPAAAASPQAGEDTFVIHLTEQDAAEDEKDGEKEEEPASTGAESVEQRQEEQASGAEEQEELEPAELKMEEPEPQAAEAEETAPEPVAEPVYRMPEPEPAMEEERPEAPGQPAGNGRKKKKKKGKILAAVILVLILGAAAVYVGFSYQYKDKFFNGTTINGVDCSGMSVEEVEERLKQQTEEYSLTLTFRDGQTETIEGSEIGYAYVSDGSVQAIKDSQVPLLWITSLFQTDEGQATADTEYDSDKLEAVLAAMPELQEEQMTAPANAYVTWQDNSFVIVPETQGNQLDTQAVRTAVAEAVAAGETELDVESLGVYAAPTVTQDDEALKTQVEQLTTLVSASITYTLPSGATQVLDGNTLRNWLTQDADGNYVKDETVWNQHIQEYVAALADSVDTLGKDREFQTTNRGVITRNSNLYGWQIDQEAEIAQLTQELANSTVTTREPVYSSREVSSENNGIGYTYVEMDLSQQHLWVYENGELWGETDIVSGTMTEARHTPECISTIYYKETDRQLRGPQNEDGTYRWDTHVDYWMPFQDSGMIGMHDAWWQSSFGGTNYIYGGSQGCINLPPTFAAQLYEWITADVPIICYYSEAYTLHE